MGTLSARLDPNPIGSVIQAIGAPNANYVAMNGQVIAKSSYPILTGSGGALVNDQYRLEASSFITTSTGMNGFNQGTANKENQVGYGGGRYWAVSTESTNPNVFYSSDGVTWANSAAIGANYTINGIIWCGFVNLYIAYGGHTTLGRQIWSSSDLNTWTNRYNEGSGALQFIHADYDGATIVAISGNGSSSVSYVYSSTGTSWSILKDNGQAAPNDSKGYIKYFQDFGIWVWAITGPTNVHILTAPTSAVAIGGFWTNTYAISKATYGAVIKLVQHKDRIVSIQSGDVTLTNMTVRYSTTTSGTTWTSTTIAWGTNCSVLDGHVYGDKLVLVDNVSTGKIWVAYDPTNYTDISSRISGIPAINGILRVRNHNSYWFFSTSADLLVSSDLITFKRLSVASYQTASNGINVIAITGTPDVRTSTPTYNTTTHVYVPERNNNGIPYYMRSK